MTLTLSTERAEAPVLPSPALEHDSREGRRGWVRACRQRLRHLVVPSDLTAAEAERIADFLDYATQRKYGG
jgi:hypothetical protein